MRNISMSFINKFNFGYIKGIIIIINIKMKKGIKLYYLLLIGKGKFSQIN